MAGSNFLLDGVRRMFGLQPDESLRGRQLQQQEEAIMNPQLRQAPVQPAAMQQPVLTPEQQDELERQEHNRRLQEALEAIRNRQF